MEMEMEMEVEQEYKIGRKNSWHAVMLVQNGSTYVAGLTCADFSGVPFEQAKRLLEERGGYVVPIKQ